MNSSIIGTYVVALRLDAPRSIPVGRLGEVAFSAGWYLYVGSAHGPGGLRARLRRHQRRIGPGKRAHWHVDYLREHAVWGGAWVRASEQRLECAWATALGSLSGAEMVASGFGSSDCRCSSHLVRLPSRPGEEWFASALGAEKMTVGNEELDDLMQTLATGDEEAREGAALALGRFGTAAVGPLTAMLVEGNMDVRWWAARALAETREKDAVPSLVSALTDADPDVRACAALALGRLGHGSAVPALAACLTDESAFVASVAADALSMIGEPAVECLAEMLGDENTHVRLLAVRALTRIKSPSAIGPLLGRLEDPSYLVRYYAQEALEALGMGMVFVAP